MNFKPLLITIGRGIAIVALLIGLEFLIVWLYSIDPKLLRIVGGVLFTVFGVVVLIYGDRKLKVDEGKIGRLFFALPNKLGFYSAMWKWVLGLISIFVGVSLIFNRL